MTAIGLRDKRAMPKLVQAMSDRKPYVQIKDLDSVVKAADVRKGGKR